MKKKTKMNILLVEDDPNLSLVLQDYLEMLNYKTTLARDGEQGMYAFERNKFDLCILDVMMPKQDGFALAGEIRLKDKEIPIIFLTAKSLKEDKIKGFKIGCDDYITKPFSTEELSLRIEAILKRCQRKYQIPDNLDDEIYQLGRIRFDYSNMILSYSNSREKKLTRKEAELLRLLCMNANRLLTRETALKTIWGDDDYFIGRSMDVFITKLRKYLKEEPKLSITNVHGTGFKLELPV